MTTRPDRRFRLARGVLILPLLSLSLLMSGCGALAVGEKRFGCQGHPSDPLCLPASRVYQLTNGTDALQPPDGERGMDTEAPTKPRQRPRAASAKSSRASTGFFGADAELFTVAETPGKRARMHDSASMDAPMEPLPSAEEDLLLPRSRDPIPLRVPAQVMRIWLAPWEDENADLHASGYVFTEITPRTWSLAAGPDRFSNALLKPLQVEQRIVPSGGDAAVRPRRQAACAGEDCPPVPGALRNPLN